MLAAIALSLAQTTSASGTVAPGTTAESAPIPSLDQATKQIGQRDAEMFWYAFEGCDASEVRARITDDFRMVHDQGGLVADNADAFAAMIDEECRKRAPDGPNSGYKNRRLLVPGSDSVTPLGQWGVLHRGFHTFHELRNRPAGVYGEGDPGGPTWVQTGGAYFINVWQWDGERGEFLMQETISVDHGAAASYPPGE